MENDSMLKKDLSRRDAMKTAMKAGAYAAPVVLSASVPAVVSAASPLPTGTLTGTVFVSAATTGFTFPGATVTVLGTGLSAITDANGNFTIANVPPGAQTVQTSLPGTGTRTDAVTITANTTSNVAISLSPNAIQVSAVQSAPTATTITETLTVSATNNLRNFTYSVFIRPNNSTDGAGLYKTVPPAGGLTTDANGNGTFTGTLVYTPTSGGTPTSLDVLVGTSSGGQIRTFYRVILTPGAGLAATGSSTLGPVTVNALTTPFPASAD